jgi:hypothetical protein
VWPLRLARGGGLQHATHNAIDELPFIRCLLMTLSKARETYASSWLTVERLELMCQLVFFFWLHVPVSL